MAKFKAEQTFRQKSLPVCENVNQQILKQLQISFMFNRPESHGKPLDVFVFFQHHPVNLTFMKETF